jgi:RNA polymerase sigma-70 factor (ECF subfamily)
MNGEEHVQGNVVLWVIMKDFGPGLLAHIRGIVQNEHDAEDVLQEVYLAASTHYQTFQQERALRPWLYAIAHNRAIDFLRRQHRRVRLVSHAVSESTHDTEGLIPESLLHDESSEEPIDALIRDERSQLLRALVASLPNQDHRQVVELVYLQTLKYQEAADAIGISIGTLKSRLHSAMIQLRELGQSAGEP